ncbi:hypothetical protein CR513_29258, partial [Mucuna pruriens]
MPQECGVSTAFNVIDLTPFVVDTQALNLRPNSLQKEEDDGHGHISHEGLKEEETLALEDPMTRGKLKKLQEEVQQELAILKDQREAKKDFGLCLGLDFLVVFVRTPNLFDPVGKVPKPKEDSRTKGTPQGSQLYNPIQREEHSTLGSRAGLAKTYPTRPTTRMKPKRAGAHIPLQGKQRKEA